MLVICDLLTFPLESSMYFYSFISTPASSKLPNKIAKNRLRRMKFPKTTKDTKYRTVLQPLHLIASYMTMFQS